MRAGMRCSLGRPAASVETIESTVRRSSAGTTSTARTVAASGPAPSAARMRSATRAAVAGAPSGSTRPGSTSSDASSVVSQRSASLPRVFISSSTSSSVSNTRVSTCVAALSADRIGFRICGSPMPASMKVVRRFGLPADCVS